MQEKFFLSIIIPIAVLLVIFTSCVKGNLPIDETIAPEQSIEIINYEGLKPYLKATDTKTYLVNFWAMWCVPCVKELPYLQQLEKTHPEIEILLVSMDFPEDIETKLIPFLKEHQITSKVVLLDDPNANYWIDQIDSTWSGAIPFTIVFNKTNRAFYERSFESLREIEEAINTTINK